MSAAQGAKELDKFFRDISGVIGNSWEAILLDNAHRVSTPLVTQMLNQISLNETAAKPFKLFDNGCGAGVVAAELQRRIKSEVLQQSTILCGDFSQQVIGLVQKRIKEEGWVNTEANTIDAQVSPRHIRTPFPSEDKLTPNKENRPGNRQLYPRDNEHRLPRHPRLRSRSRWYVPPYYPYLFPLPFPSYPIPANPLLTPSRIHPHPLPGRHPRLHNLDRPLRLGPRCPSRIRIPPLSRTIHRLDPNDPLGQLVRPELDPQDAPTQGPPGRESRAVRVPAAGG